MKKLLVGLLLLAGCSSSPVSIPSFQAPTLRPGNETLYLGDLYRYGYRPIDDAEIRDRLVDLGWQTCEAFDADVPDHEIFFTMTDGGATDEQAFMVMTAARDQLCPDIPRRE